MHERYGVIVLTAHEVPDYIVVESSTISGIFITVASFGKFRVIFPILVWTMNTRAQDGQNTRVLHK